MPCGQTLGGRAADNSSAACRSCLAGRPWAVAVPADNSSAACLACPAGRPWDNSSAACRSCLAGRPSAVAVPADSSSAVCLACPAGRPWVTVRRRALHALRANSGWRRHDRRGRRRAVQIASAVRGIGARRTPAAAPVPGHSRHAGGLMRRRQGWWRQHRGWGFCKMQRGWFRKLRRRRQHGWWELLYRDRGNTQRGRKFTRSLPGSPTKAAHPMQTLEPVNARPNLLPSRPATRPQPELGNWLSGP